MLSHGSALRPPIWVTALLLGLLLSRAVAAPAELSLPFERYRLPNGLTVILHPDRSSPQVGVNLWYGVGSANERPGKTGFAHLFEHLMFTGSRHAPEGTFDRLMEAEGGTNNATTAEDRTNYFEQGPSHLLETFLWLEADRLATLGAFLTLNPLNRQREVVRNELRESYENQPYGVADLRLPGLLYPPGHPYSWPVIGSHADLVAASLDDVRGFFARYYTPANASLAIAGAFELAEARRLVEKYFGWIPGSAAPPRPQAPPPWLPSLRRVTMTDRVALPRVTMVWHSPPIYAPGDAECDLLAAILGRGKSSRLYRELVHRRRLAQEVSASQTSRRLGSLFSVEVIAAPGSTPLQLERAIDAQLAALRARGPSRVELQRARTQIEADFVRHLESLADRADLLNQYQFYLGDPGALRRDLQRYRRATPEGLRRTAAKLLGPRQRLTLVVVPGKRAADLTTLLPRNKNGTQPPALAGTTFPSGEEGSTVPAPLRTFPDFMSGPPRVGPPPPIRLPTPERFRLRNGLEVLVLERPRLPLVTARLTIGAGAADDPPGRAGLASLVAAMLDEGAGRRSSEQTAELLERNAIEFSAFADRETSALQASALSGSLALMLELVGEMAARPRFDAGEFARVRGEHLAELAQRRTEPEEIADLVLRRALYGDRHPYGRPIAGYPTTVRAVRHSDLWRFHRRHYRPDNALLIVAGDVTPARLRPMVERAFGGWARVKRRSFATSRRGTRPAAARQSPRYGVPSAFPRLILVPFPGAPQAVLRIGLPGPERGTPDFAALEAANIILGGSFSSRLNLNLRERHGYSYGAWSQFAWARGPGPFVVGASVARRQTAPALAECLRELSRLRDGPIEEEELRKAKALARQARVERLSLTGGLVELYSEPWEYGLPADDPARFLAQLPRLGADDLRRAVSRTIDPGRVTIVVVGDAAIRASLAALKLGPVELRNVEGEPIPSTRTARPRPY